MKPKPLTVFCSAGHRFLAPQSLAGCEVVCPYCGRKVPVADRPPQASERPPLFSQPPTEGGNPPITSADDVSRTTLQKTEGESQSKITPPDVGNQIPGRHRLLRSPQAFNWLLRIRTTQKQGLPWAYGVVVPTMILTVIAAVLAFRSGTQGWAGFLLAFAFLTLGSLFLIEGCADWLTFRLAGITLAAGAVAGGSLAGWVLSAPPNQLEFWALGHLRDAAVRWAVSLCLFYLVGAFLLFRTAATCRKKAEILLKVARKSCTPSKEPSQRHAVSLRS